MKQLQEGPGSTGVRANEVLWLQASGQLPWGLQMLSLVKGIIAL